MILRDLARFSNSELLSQVFPKLWATFFSLPGATGAALYLVQRLGDFLEYVHNGVNRVLRACLLQSHLNHVDSAAYIVAD